MKRFSVCTACLLVGVTAWLAGPAAAVDLPFLKPFFIMNESNGFDLEGNVGLATTGIQVRDFSNDFANTPQWGFVPTGQPGRVVIVKADALKALWFLEADKAVNLISPVDVKVSPFTAIAAVPPTGQWRIIESPVNGPFNIMHVQTGRLLGVDSTDLAGKKVQLQGRDGSAPSRQWRIFPSNPFWTTPKLPKLNDPLATSPAGKKLLFLPDIGLPGHQSVELTGEDFTNQVVEVTVEVTLVGNATNKLAAEVKMTVKGSNGKPPVEDKKVYPIVEVAAGRKIFLNPVAGLNPSQNFTYKAGPSQALDKLWKLVSEFPDSKSKDNLGGPLVTLVGSPKIESLVGAVIPSPLNTPAAQIANDPKIPFRLMNLCLCIGDPSGNPAGVKSQPTGVSVWLESIPYFTDIPPAPPPAAVLVVGGPKMPPAGGGGAAGGIKGIPGGGAPLGGGGAPSNTGSDLTQAEANELLKRHNKIRGDLGIPPVGWDTDLAQKAQKWANAVAGDNSDPLNSGDSNRIHGPHPDVFNQYGQNMFWGTGNFQAADAVDMPRSAFGPGGWVNERDVNKYTPGTKVTFANVFKIGHYTQMIWRATAKIGAGKATIRSGKFNNGAVIVCNYGPPGNRIGQDAETNK